MRVVHVVTGTLLAAVCFIPVSAGAQSRVDIRQGEPVLTVEAGGGYFGFTDEQLGKNTDAGATAGVRATVMPAWPVSLEIGYAGSIVPVDLRNDSRDLDAVIGSNSGEAMLKVNPLEIAGFEQSSVFHLTPYLAAGAGYTAQEVLGDDRNDADVEATFRRDTDGLSLPAAVGLNARFQAFTIGARLAYSYIPDNELTRKDGNDASQSWGATANVGATF